MCTLEGPRDSDLKRLGTILYVGDLSEGTTTLDRLKTLRILGSSVVPFDTGPYLRGGSRIFRSLGWRFYAGPNVSELNRDLRNACKAWSNVKTIWIDKGVWIWKSTLAFLKESLNAGAIHFTPDPAIVFHRSPHFLNSIPLYDHLFTFKDYEVELYRKYGAARTHLLSMSYESARFFPREPIAKYQCDVIFVGHKESHYVRHLREVAKLGVDLRIWGPGWDTSWYSPAWQRRCVRGSGIWGEEYPRALSSAKIGIGLLTKLAPDLVTTRSLEIPACGTFMLAESSPGHAQMFRDNEEAVLFNSPSDLAGKVRHYLAEGESRIRIADAGYQRCRLGKYSNEARLREVLELAGT